MPAVSHFPAPSGSGFRVKGSGFKPCPRLLLDVEPLVLGGAPRGLHLGLDLRVRGLGFNGTPLLQGWRFRVWGWAEVWGAGPLGLAKDVGPAGRGPVGAARRAAATLWAGAAKPPAPPPTLRRSSTSPRMTTGSGAAPTEAPPAPLPTPATLGSGGMDPSAGRCTVVKQMLYSWRGWWGGGWGEGEWRGAGAPSFGASVEGLRFFQVTTTQNSGPGPQPGFRLSGTGFRIQDLGLMV
jgi:hypothetical protein